ncbi:hypothetical protein GINT2_001395 [Glugoides intestinalis]
MQSFKTGLVLCTTSKKDLKLPATYFIRCIDHKFAIDKSMCFLYAIENGITVYSTNPFNKVKSLDYKKGICSIAITNDSLFLLNDESLVVYSKKGFNVLTGDFADFSVAAINDNMIGLLNQKELSLYTEAFMKMATIGCQCFFSARKLLLAGEMNKIHVFINGVKKLDICMPDYITCLIANSLLSRIYCATKDNCIYCFDLNGLPQKTMDFHLTPVKQMKLSFCEQYLYSLEDTRICIWNAIDCVVIGYLDVEEGVDSFETILIDDFEIDQSRILI